VLSRRTAPPRQRPLGLEQFEARNLLATKVLTPVADNTIYQDSGSLSNGAGQYLFAGQADHHAYIRHALLKFDVAAAIPAGSRIDNATLRLNLSGLAINPVATFFGVHRLTADWGEGTSVGTGTESDGGPATTGDATFTRRFFDTVAWTNVGGDFVPGYSAVTSIGGVGSYEWSSSQLIADVQGWLNASLPQYGWLIKETNESVGGTARRFDSRQHSVAANRPTLTIEYTPVNQAPTLNALTDPLLILEDAALQIINLSGISAGPGENQNISITATSSNPTLIPNLVVNHASPDSTGTIEFTPAADRSGSAVITVKVQDDGGTAGGGVDTLQRTFTVTVTAVNDPPTLEPISNPVPLLEDADQRSISLKGISAGLLETQDRTVTAISDNPDLIPNPAVSYVSPNSTGLLTYKPAANRSGTANITVTVKDGGGTANDGVDTISQSFTVTVNAVNDPPTLDPISDPTAIPENSGQQTISLSNITAGPLEDQSLLISAESSNTGLIPHPTVDHSIFQTTGSLRYTAVTNQFGSAVITVTVRDEGFDEQFNTPDDGIITRSFNVLVAPESAVNLAPSFVKGADQSVMDKDGPISLPGWATDISPGSPEESEQTIDFIIIVQGVPVFSVPPDVDSAGTLTFTPALNAHGVAHVTVRLKDNGGTANGGVDTSQPQTFDITVTKPLRWHNSVRALDVGDPFGTAVDNVVSPSDALLIINFLNAFGPGPVPENAVGPPYYDTTDGAGLPTGDDFVAAGDALAIINFINAFDSGLPGPQGEDSSPTSSEQATDADLMAAIIADQAWQAQTQRRRK
jgi:hypothetical protein